MRRPFVAGNWKMNMDLASARTLVSGLCEKLGGSSPIDIAICPPATYLFAMAKAVEGSPIMLGAQNCWHEPKGAFTGEISVDMVKDTGAKFVILGHSERRHTIGPEDSNGRIQGETDAMIAKKAKAVMAGGLVPIVCVGETLDERDAGKTDAVLSEQIKGSLAGLDITDPAKIVVAYEPVWAIGTGRTATPEQAQQAHKHIRSLLAGQFGQDIADGIRLQYGGSVKPDNVNVLMSCPDVDGALVGGASMKTDDFVGIIEGCASAKNLA